MSEINYEAEVKQVYPDAGVKRVYGYPKRNKVYVFGVFKYGAKHNGDMLSDWVKDSKSAWSNAYYTHINNLTV